MNEKMQLLDAYRYGGFKPDLKQVFAAMTEDPTEIGTNPDWTKRILETASPAQIEIVQRAITKTATTSEAAWELGLFAY